ncbi:MAG: cell division protein WhiA [Clostridia bacterium]|nr:cell division protein WhiA [Clostridia bacterium]
MVQSFSLQTKEELARIKSKKRCCRKTELMALLRLGGFDSISKQNVVVWSTYYVVVARKFYSLAKEFITPNVSVENGRKSSRGRATLKVVMQTSRENIEKWLNEKETVPEYRCCRAAYLRGAFLISGSVNRPSGTHHLEYFFSDETEANFMKELMEKLEIEARLSQRQRGYIIYLKDSEQIVRTLSLMGAYNAVLAYENVLVYRDMRNQVNRLVNCETANLNKTVETGLRQAENIRYLVTTIGWDSLPQSLKEIANLRLQYPEASLKELGEMLNPPIGKSGVNHRLRRLERLTKQVRTQGKN